MAIRAGFGREAQERQTFWGQPARPLAHVAGDMMSGNVDVVVVPLVGLGGAEQVVAAGTTLPARQVHVSGVQSR